MLKRLSIHVRVQLLQSRSLPRTAFGGNNTPISRLRSYGKTHANNKSEVISVVAVGGCPVYHTFELDVPPSPAFLKQSSSVTNSATFA